MTTNRQNYQNNSGFVVTETKANTCQPKLLHLTKPPMITDGENKNISRQIQSRELGTGNGWSSFDSTTMKYA